MVKDKIHPGSKFGRLTAIALDKPPYWRFKCSCGKTVRINLYSVVHRQQVSCGCYKNHLSTRRIIKFSITHGKSKLKIYQVWASMMARCYSRNSKTYKNYGARGITVCKRWKKFVNFLTDMGYRPSTQHSLGRISNEKGYYLKNCRWETRKQQGQNKRNCHYYTYLGRRQCLSAWADELNINRNTLYARLARGTSVHKSFTAPVLVSKRK